MFSRNIPEMSQYMLFSFALSVVSSIPLCCWYQQLFLTYCRTVNLITASKRMLYFGKPLFNKTK